VVLCEYLSYRAVKLQFVYFIATPFPHKRNDRYSIIISLCVKVGGRGSSERFLNVIIYFNMNQDQSIVVFNKKHWTMDKVPKQDSSKCIAPSSELFRKDQSISLQQVM
jgi:GTP-binding protein EngB required for normal cell division